MNQLRVNFFAWSFCTLQLNTTYSMRESGCRLAYWSSAMDLPAPAQARSFIMSPGRNSVCKIASSSCVTSTSALRTPLGSTVDQQCVAVGCLNEQVSPLLICLCCFLKKQKVFSQ